MQPTTSQDPFALALALYPTCRAGFNILCRRSERKRQLARAEYTAPDSHFGRKWLWRAASATSFGSAAAVIGFFGLLLLQLPSRPHLLTPTHIAETAAQAATAAPRAVEADPVNGTALPTGPTRAPR